MNFVYLDHHHRWIIGSDWTLESDTELLQDISIKLGAYVRPFGKLISTMPPFV